MTSNKYGSAWNEDEERTLGKKEMIEARQNAVIIKCEEDRNFELAEKLKKEFEIKNRKWEEKMDKLRSYDIDILKKMSEELKNEEDNLPDVDSYSTMDNVETLTAAANNMVHRSKLMMERQNVNHVIMEKEGKF